MSNRTLNRRASYRDSATFWLDTTDDDGFCIGFAQLHTSNGTGRPNPRAINPRLAQLAAVVERAPELAHLLRAAVADPTDAAWLAEARTLLAELEPQQ